MRAANDNAVSARGKAIRDLAVWFQGVMSLRALEEIDLDALSDRDLDLIFGSDGKILRVPHLGRVT